MIEALMPFAGSLVPSLTDVIAAIKEQRQRPSDTDALQRLLRLEIRRNLGVLDVAVGASEPLPTAALWDVVPVLTTDVLTIVLGVGPAASDTLKALYKLDRGSDEGELPAPDLLTAVYSRIGALKALALVNQRHALAGVKIELRLTNLRKDLVRLVKVLEA